MRPSVSTCVKCVISGARVQFWSRDVQIPFLESASAHGSKNFRNLHPSASAHRCFGRTPILTTKVETNCVIFPGPVQICANFLFFLTNQWSWPVEPYCECGKLPMYSLNARDHFNCSPLLFSLTSTTKQMRPNGKGGRQC